MHPGNWILVPEPSFIHRVAFDKSLYFCEPQFPHLYHGNNNMHSHSYSLRDKSSLPPPFVNKVLLVHSHADVFRNCLGPFSVLQQQSWVAVTEIVRSSKPNTLNHLTLPRESLLTPALEDCEKPTKWLIWKYFINCNIDGKCKYLHFF